MCTDEIHRAHGMRIREGPTLRRSDDELAMGALRGRMASAEPTPGPSEPYPLPETKNRRTRSRGNATVLSRSSLCRRE